MALKEFISDVYIDDLDSVKKYELSPGMVNEEDEKGFTALHWNCFLGETGRNRLEICKLLLESGADPNKRIAGDGMSPLLMACESGNDKIVELLLLSGADPNLVADGSTPLIQAVTSGNKKSVMHLLLFGAKADAKDESNQTAIEKAKEYERFDMVDTLSSR